MTELRQRQPRQEDAKHLALLRTLPCCCGCGRPAPSDPAHIRAANLDLGKPFTGKVKPDDKWTTPLNRVCHDAQHDHKQGEMVFWRERGKDPFVIAMGLWKLSGGEARALETKAPRKPKKIKPRKPVAKRKKVPAGRPLRSNPVIQSRPFEKRDQP